MTNVVPDLLVRLIATALVVTLLGAGAVPTRSEAGTKTRKALPLGWRLV